MKASIRLIRFNRLMAAMLVAAVPLVSVAQTAGQSARPGLSAISGQLRNMDGSWAAGIRVSAVDAESGDAAGGAVALIGSAETDDSGRFRIEGLPPGRYYVIAGLLDFPTYFPGVKTLREARAVTISGAAAAANVDFALAISAGVRVAGQVAGLPQGLSPGMVRIALRPVTPPGVSPQVPIEREAHSDGTFEFTRVGPGSYAPVVTVLGRFASSTAILVGERDITGLELSSAPMVVGSVQVEGGGGLPVAASMGALGRAPTSDVPSMVQFQTWQLEPGKSLNTSGDKTSSAVVRADGLFSLSGVPGDYQLLVAALPVGYYVRSIMYGAADLLKGPLHIGSAGAEQVRVVLTTTRPADAPPEVKLSGKLTGLPEGTPASSRAVTLQMTVPSSTASGVGAAIRRVAELEFRADGTFELLHVPAGSWNVSILDLDNRSQSNLQTLVVGDSDMTEVELRAPASPVLHLSTVAPAALNRAFPPGMLDVSGRFLVDGIAALPDELARIQLSARIQNSQRNSVPMGGLIAMQLPPGQYDMSVLNLPATYAVDSILYAGIDHRSVPLKVDGPLSSEIIVRLSKFPPSGPFARVSGKVTNLPAAPYIQDPKIILMRDAQAGGGGLEASVQADGTFEFRVVPPGPYAVTTSDLTSAVTQKMDVRNTDIPDLTIALAGLATPFAIERSVAGEFASGVSVTLRGIITQEITQVRPPFSVAYFRMEVPDASGQPKSWAVQISVPAGTRSVSNIPDIGELKTGTRIMVVGNPARDGSNRMFLIPREGPYTVLGIEIE